jgi:hypothetical protein
MINFTAAQAESGVSVLPALVQRQYAEGCVLCVWSVLGKQLQQAAGVAEAELEGDGSQPGDAAEAGSNSSGGPLYREGVEVEVPGDAAARMQMLWEEYSRCLFGAIMLYQGGCRCMAVDARLPNDANVTSG